MKKRCKLIIFVVLFLSLGMVFSGCGDGGGDGGGAVTHGITSDDAAFAVSAAGGSFEVLEGVLEGAFSALEFPELFGVQRFVSLKSLTIDGTESNPEKLKAALSALINKLKSSSIVGASAIQLRATTDCGTSGTGTYDSTQVDNNTVQITVTFENCVGGDGESSMNGSLTITATDPGYGGTDPLNDVNFNPTEFTIVLNELEYTRTVDGIVVARYYANGTYTITLNESNGTITLTIGVNGEFGRFDEEMGSGSMVCTNFTVSGSFITDPTTDEPIEFSLTLDDSIEYTDSSNSDNSVSVTYTNLVITMSEDADGNTIATINGTIDSTCLGGAVTFETIEPIVIPPGEDLCPTAGGIKITRGSSTATLTLTSTGGVEVDLDSDGTVDASYASCDDVPEVC